MSATVHRKSYTAASDPTKPPIVQAGCMRIMSKRDALTFCDWLARQWGWL